MLRYRNRREGVIIPFVAVLIVPLIGICGLVIDGGYLMAQRRFCQNAADAAALAGCGQLAATGSTSATSTPGAGYTAFEYLNANLSQAPSTAFGGTYNVIPSSDFAINSSVTSGNYTVQVNIPPSTTTSAYSAAVNGVEVLVQCKVNTFFMTIFGNSSQTAAGHATAASTKGQNSILILHQSEEAALEIRGPVTIMNGGQIYSNSNNTTSNDSASQGATGSVYVGNNITVGGINGRGSVVTGSGVTVTYQNASGSSFSGSPATSTTIYTDPLASLPDPTTTGLTNYGSVSITTSTTLNPGVYTSITIGSSSTTPTVTMNPGIYWINGETPSGQTALTADYGSSNNQPNLGLTIVGGNLTGTGVMIVNNTATSNTNVIDSVFGWTNPAFYDPTTSKYGTGSISITPPSVTTAGANSGGTWPQSALSPVYTSTSYSTGGRHGTNYTYPVWSEGTTTNATTAATYQGISLWVPRSLKSANPADDQGGGSDVTPEFHFMSYQNVNMPGTFYAQGAEYDVRANQPGANGTPPTFTIGGYIASLGEWNQKYGGDSYTGLGTININPGQAALTNAALVE